MERRMLELPSQEVFFEVQDHSAITNPAATAFRDDIQWYPLIKRATDLVLASVLMILLLPLLCAVAILIRLTSRGPVLFCQKRVKQNSELFTIYKFRSMRVDADPRVHEEAIRRYFEGKAIAEGNPRLGYKLVEDTRITPLGAFLRKTSIDELPQLLNVIRGDMSLVGPRPAMPYEVMLYSEHARIRLTVPQGVTGLWQVKGRSRVSCQEALALDIEYARHCSWTLDCKILLLTIPTLLLARGGA